MADGHCIGAMESNGSVKYTVPSCGIWMNVGGNIVRMNLMRTVGCLHSVEAIAHTDPHQDYGTLDDVVTDDQMFAVHWGPDVERLLDRLAGRRLVCRAYSTGYISNMLVMI